MLWQWLGRGAASHSPQTPEVARHGPGAAEPQKPPVLGTLLCNVGRAQAVEGRQAFLWQCFPTAADVLRPKLGPDGLRRKRLAFR